MWLSAGIPTANNTWTIYIPSEQDSSADWELPAYIAHDNDCESITKEIYDVLYACT